MYIYILYAYMYTYIYIYCMYIHILVYMYIQIYSPSRLCAKNTITRLATFQNGSRPVT